MSGILDPNTPIRQQAYLRALRTLPNVEIIAGHFRTDERSMALANMPDARVKVIKTEEKGSDVNLGCHLVHDAHLGYFNIAAVISNDSDLAEPMRLVRDEIGKPIIQINPHKYYSAKLAEVVTMKKQIRPWVLPASQFPDKLEDTEGSIHKPRTTAK